MADDPGSSSDGRSNNGTNNYETGNRIPFPMIQSQGMNFITHQQQLPVIGNYNNMDRNQGTAVNPTSVHPFPGVASLNANSIVLSNMLEMYQLPPFSSLSLEQIATALLHGSSSGGSSSTQTTAIQGLLSQPPGGLYASIPLQRLEVAAFPGPVPPPNILGNSAFATNPPSYYHNEGSLLTTETPGGNAASNQSSEDPDAKSTEPDQPSNYSRVLYMPLDEENLSQYQCLLRQHIEIFQATEDDLSEKSQGRNRPIILGQVGIRCRHCVQIPSKERAKGGKFFPSNLGALYQTAQNLANTHLLFNCTEIPTAVREDMFRLRSHDKSSKTCKSAYGSGRSYWSTCLRVQGVIDTEDRRLIFAHAFAKKRPPSSSST